MDAFELQQVDHLQIVSPVSSFQNCSLMGAACKNSGADLVFLILRFYENTFTGLMNKLTD